MSKDPEQFFEAMTGMMSTLQKDDGNITRCKDASGDDVLVHVSPEGDITTLKCTDDIIQDLAILKLLAQNETLKDPTIYE